MQCTAVAHLTPAAYVIRKAGGVRATARLVGRTPGAVSQWRRTGNVPVEAQQILLRHAKVAGLDLAAEALILGWDVES